MDLVEMLKAHLQCNLLQGALAGDWARSLEVLHNACNSVLFQSNTLVLEKDNQCCPSMNLKVEEVDFQHYADSVKLVPLQPAQM